MTKEKQEKVVFLLLPIVLLETESMTETTASAGLSATASATGRCVTCRYNLTIGSEAESGR